MDITLKHQDIFKKEHRQDFPLIKGFQESTLIDWDGRIASIIFLGGCNFRCGFCHSKALVDDFTSIETIPFCRIADFLKNKKEWIDGVVITGGEPTIYENSLLDFINAIRDLGFGVKLDTNGTNPKLLKKIIENNMVDYIAMDIKAPLNEIDYENAVRCSVDIEKIILSKDILLTSDFDYEFRTTIVPGIINKENIISIADDIKKAKKYCLQQFVPRDTLDPEFLLLPPYSIEDIQEMAESILPYLEKVIVRPN
jgi:pyruvate formate lyase activating enzyme